MDLSGLGALAQGMQAGQSHSMDLRTRAMTLQQQQLQLDAQKRQIAADAALGNSLGGGAPGGQGGPPGMHPVAPQGGQRPMAGPDMGFTAPQHVGVPGAMPMGGGGQGGPPQPPMGGGGGMQPPMGGPGMQPQGGGAQGGMSGVAQPTGDPMHDSMATLKSIASDIKARNPGIDGPTLLAATERQIGLMKGLEPETRDLMKAQVELVKAQTAAQAKIQSAQIGSEARTDSAHINADSRRDVEHERAGSNERIANTQAGSRMTVAEVMAHSRTQSAQITADARRDVSANSVDADLYKSDQSYRRAVDAAAVANSKPVGTGGRAPARPTPRAGGGGGQAVRPVQVKSEADYNKVPKGAQYVDPEGNIRTKG